MLFWPLVTVLFVWSILGLIWAATSTHKWNDHCHPFIAGPAYWLAAALYHAILEWDRSFGNHPDEVSD